MRSFKAIQHFFAQPVATVGYVAAALFVLALFSQYGRDPLCMALIALMLLACLATFGAIMQEERRAYNQACLEALDPCLIRLEDLTLALATLDATYNKLPRWCRPSRTSFELLREPLYRRKSLAYSRRYRPVRRHGRSHGR